METSTKQFVWALEITSIEDWLVTFIDGTSTTLTDKQLTYLVTNESKDLTQTRDLVLANIVPEILAAIQAEVIWDKPVGIVAKILEVIEQHNIKRGDFAVIMDAISYKFKLILDTAVQSYNEVFNKAIWKAFGTYKEWRASAYFLEDITVKDMQEAINN